jgi:hypothetical protein
VAHATLADLQADARAIINITVTKTSNQLAALAPLEQPIAEYMAAILNNTSPRAQGDPSLFMVKYRERTKSFTLTLPAMLQATVVDAGVFRIDHQGTKFALHPVHEEAPTKAGEGNKVQTIYWGTLVTGIKETAPISVIRDATLDALGAAGFKVKEGKAGFNTILSKGMLTNKFAINFDVPTEYDIENMIRAAKTVRQIRVGNNAADFYLNRELCSTWQLCNQCYTSRAAAECGCAARGPRKNLKRKEPSTSGATFGGDVDF